MPIRHRDRHRLQPRGITPRRLAAARRALAKERGRLADQGHRDLAARHWRFGRRQLANLSDAVRGEIIASWNASSIPPDAHYFADFVRRELWRRHIPLKDNA